jgi:peptidoglycan hydrolase-like protein with peptidoglycan-binding domain
MVIAAPVCFYLPPIREAAITAPSLRWVAGGNRQNSSFALGLGFSLLAGSIALSGTPALAIQPVIDSPGFISEPTLPEDVILHAQQTLSAQPLLVSQVGGSLQFGSFGSEVENLQIRLRDLGLYNGAIDGDFGSGTEAAVQEFQRRNGITVDGIVGPETDALLRSSVEQAVPQTTQPFSSQATPDDGLLSVGDTGPEVSNLQIRLRDLGLYNGAIDGDFGSGTEAAVQEFQRRNGLTADGVVGQSTRDALFGSASARPSGRFSVAELQERLQRRGFYQGEIDGAAGTATRQAIEAAQRNYELREGDIP